MSVERILRLLGIGTDVSRPVRRPRDLSLWDKWILRRETSRMVREIGVEMGRRKIRNLRDLATRLNDHEARLSAIERGGSETASTTTPTCVTIDVGSVKKGDICPICGSRVTA